MRRRSAPSPGYGEVIGLPDALYVWFGTDFNQAMKVLNSTPKKKEEWARKGEIYRQVLALLLSGRLPSHYLITDRDGLDELADGYVSALEAAGAAAAKAMNVAGLAEPLFSRPARSKRRDDDRHGGPGASHRRAAKALRPEVRATDGYGRAPTAARRQDH